MKNTTFKNLIENELMNSMEKQLVSSQIEDQHKFTKLARAIDYLNAAANIFEQAGLRKEADDVTEIIEEIDSKGEEKASPEEVADVLEKLQNSDLTMDDLKNIFWSSPGGIQLAVLGKLYDIAKGTTEEGLFKTLNKEFKENFDISNPVVLEKYKDTFSDHLNTGIKALKAAVTFGLV